MRPALALGLTAALRLTHELGGSRMGACALLWPGLARGTQRIEARGRHDADFALEVTEHRLGAEAGMALGARWDVGEDTAALPWAQASVYPTEPGTGLGLRVSWRRCHGNLKL